MSAITVEVRDVYGKQVVYPMDASAMLFADIAGTTTLTEATLRRIKALGFDIVITQRKLDL